MDCANCGKKKDFSKRLKRSILISLSVIFFIFIFLLSYKNSQAIVVFFLMMAELRIARQLGYLGGKK